MVKYKITFDFDLEEPMSYDDDYSVDILDFDDSSFYDIFDSKEKIKEFENWWNDGSDSDEDKINVIDLYYEGDYDESGEVYITLENEYKDLEDLKTNILDYLFDNDWPTLRVQITGDSYEDYWDYARSSPEQRSIKVDYEEDFAISHYKNAKIVKL